MAEAPAILYIKDVILLVGKNAEVPEGYYRILM